MLKGMISRVFGTRHERERRRVQPIIDEIVAVEARIASLSDSEIQAQTTRFRERIAARTGPIELRIAELKAAKLSAAAPEERERIDHDLHGVDGRAGAESELRTAIVEMLDELLPEAFATVR